MSTSLVELVATISMYGIYGLAAVLCVVVYFRRRIPRVVTVCILVVTFTFIWMRYIEPQMILVRTTQIETGFASHFVLISDMHLGVFKDERFLTRVVDTINTLDVPYVFIAGDLTYLPHKEDIETLFAPLSRLRANAYTVLGNHDVHDANYTFREELVNTLEKNDVVVLENGHVALDGFTLVGLGDHYAEEDDVDAITYAQTTHTVALMHNPDTAMQLGVDVPLSLSGHTHCGQVRIPLLYKKMIPTNYAFDGGLYMLPRTKLFISCGLGESGIPLRLFNPPVIDIIETR